MSKAMKGFGFLCSAIRCGQEWDEHCEKAAEAVRTALEQPGTTEHGEAVATVSSFCIGKGGPRLKHLSVHEEIENLPDGTKLYAAPPSMAEAQVRSLEEVANLLLEVRMSDALSKGDPAQLAALQNLKRAEEVLAKVFNELTPVLDADAEAKRIREEG